MTAAPPTISVIIPARNAAPHLRVCLSSLATSTRSDHETIVVDDASTDETPGVAEAMGARLLRLERHSGPAAARNHGAACARGGCLLFVDADVAVRPETLELVLAAFEQDASLDALFGSYDETPADPGAVSQYKNLLHHFVHQQGREEAFSFWSGCGAIRREVFQQLGGFRARYRRPSIEDIELGARLRKAGRRVCLRREIQVKHLKRWTLASLLRSDICDRAIPWTRLLLSERRLPNDLNLGVSQRLSAALALALAASLALAPARPALLALTPLAWLGILALNRPLYSFFLCRRGAGFLAVALPLHLLYYLYSSLGVLLGVVLAVGERLGLTSRRQRASVPLG